MALTHRVISIMARTKGYGFESDDIEQPPMPTVAGFRVLNMPAVKERYPHILQPRPLRGRPVTKHPVLQENKFKLAVVKKQARGLAAILQPKPVPAEPIPTPAPVVPKKVEEPPIIPPNKMVILDFDLNKRLNVGDAKASQLSPEQDAAIDLTAIANQIEQWRQSSESLTVEAPNDVSEDSSSLETCATPAPASPNDELEFNFPEQDCVDTMDCEEYYIPGKCPRSSFGDDYVEGWLNYEQASSQSSLSESEIETFGLDAYWTSNAATEAWC